MKKLLSQISMGIIFLLFGFMITTQLNTVNNQVVKSENDQSPEILLENEQLKKQKEEIQKKVNELTSKVEEYESAAAGKTEESTIILQELQDTRLRTGLTNVHGEGITIYIDPKAHIFSSSTDKYPIIDFDLLTIVNELFAAGAEAVSINDIRITANTGIRTAGNSIIINTERISPQKRVTIKAIGKKDILEGIINFPGTIPDRLRISCDVTHEVKADVTIKKSSNPVKYEYVKEVKE